MDSKTLNRQLAASLQLSSQQVSSLLGGFAKVLASSAETLSTVAIPSFGTFNTVKYDEEIKTDLETGRRLLFPPRIVLEFNPASSLRKKLAEGHE